MAPEPVAAVCGQVAVELRISPVLFSVENDAKSGGGVLCL